MLYLRRIQPLFAMGTAVVVMTIMASYNPHLTTTEGFSLGRPILSSSTMTKAMSTTDDSFTWSLSMAKSKNKRSTNSKGFGKVEAPQIQPLEDVASAIDKGGSTTSSSPLGSAEGLLKSVEGGSTTIPQIDPSIPVEDRTKSILREQYGLRTREEQQEAERKQKQIMEQRKKLQEWKKLAEEGEDFDLMQILPEPVLIGIDRFLKIGVAISTVLFVGAGILITIEAYSKTTGNALPNDLDQFITNQIEPNFTPGLLVLLGFSVSLGAFAAAQLSSASSNYREGGR
mmetsp:Transcript_124232/g.356950  ORF Transcript_124232/g.356950 Transcript_124232/m.356950 type:complete len:285 (+) Transcript_124232:156-1010(+)